ncbi:MAG: NAD(P)-binding domain-containing protein [Planctomycetes bacterium]|nr:NAD(P)-binding domain-containing protein [Planctomycetota bacterium]
MRTILIQLDTDAHPSVFDRVVAVDAGVDEVFSYGGVQPDTVEGLVHGAIFTRGPDDLRNTALFIGGSDLETAERVADRAQQAFFGPLRVSVLLDPSGCNTTAAAAVIAVSRHVDLGDCRATVLGATGPVGRRVAHLLASEGAEVRIGSRSLAKAERLRESLRKRLPDGRLLPCQTATEAETEAACRDADVLVAAGAAGVQLVSPSLRQHWSRLRVAVDLNAVPPAGVAGIDPADRGVERDGTFCYGAIGVGGWKMKIHKAAVRRLFESNDQVLDTDAIYRLARSLILSDG